MELKRVLDTSSYDNAVGQVRQRQQLTLDNQPERQSVHALVLGPDVIDLITATRSHRHHVVRFTHTGLEPFILQPGYGGLRLLLAFACASPTVAGFVRPHPPHVTLNRGQLVPASIVPLKQTRMQAGKDTFSPRGTEVFYLLVQGRSQTGSQEEAEACILKTGRADLIASEVSSGHPSVRETGRLVRQVLQGCGVVLSSIYSQLGLICSRHFPACKFPRCATELLHQSCRNVLCVPAGIAPLSGASRLWRRPPT